ncbi:MAG: hypothetical protein NTV80_26840 [Verrucomicrobia bacterium]|nr:hypothetical protein [Verrucomicrobiota bacterium]
MIATRRTKAGCLILLVIGFSLGVGFVLGVLAMKANEKKKENPAFWKENAMKHLEKLHPTDEQRQRFEAHTDKAVGELTTLRKGAIESVWQIVDQALISIEKDLTPEQKATFEKLRPKPPPEIARP